MIYKVVLLGDAKVGKTSLRRNYMGQHFEEDHQWTIGADISYAKRERDNFDVNLQIWDMGGQPNFSQVRKQYYVGAHGILLVFDLSNMQTLSNLSNWMGEYKSGNPLNADKPPIVLLGNKNDLLSEIEGYDENEYQEKIEDARNAVSNMLDKDVPFIRTSALTGENVPQAFDQLIDQLITMDF